MAITPNPPMSDWTRAELLLLREVVKRIGKGLSPEPAIHEMLHLMSELLGLNRGRVVLRNGEAGPQAARIVYAYGLTQEQIERGHYLLREGVTGQVLATGHPAINNGLFVGQDSSTANVMMSSPDGINWTEHYIEPT
ncbi:MAG: hypothetical protein ACO3QP_06365, partial [Burkholderiaceae bacterium]